MERNSKGLLVGLLLGAVVGFIGGGLISGLLTWHLATKRAHELRKGWNLVPVVVAAQDLGEGEVVTFDRLVQRSVPEQFVTSSVVKPGSADHIVNQRLLVPVRAGDMLLWSQFETRKAEGMSADSK